MKKIFVAGSLNMDLVINSPYCPQAGETITGSGFLTNCGGKGANQAAACGKLGGRVRMAGCVGSDAFGEELIARLTSYGVQTDAIRRVEGPSGIAVILVVGGDNRIILDRGANAALSPADLDRLLDEAEPGDIFLTQLETPLEVVGYGLKKAKEKGLLTILNPAPADPAVSAWFSAVDIITPNESELEILGGAEKLLGQGIRQIILTQGGKGQALIDAAGRREFSCPKVKPVDTTAAGDTFCGGLAVELANGASIPEAMIFAGLAASLSVTRKGAQQSIPTREEVLAFARSLDAE